MGGRALRRGWSPSAQSSRNEVFRFWGQAVGHQAKAVGPLPSIIVRELQRFRPGPQHRQPIGCSICRIVDHHRFPHHRGPETLAPILFQLCFHLYFQRAEPFWAASPAFRCPRIAVPPEPPDFRFLQSIVEQKFCRLIVPGSIPRKIPYPTAVAWGAGASRSAPALHKIPHPADFPAPSGVPRLWSGCGCIRRLPQCPIFS